MIESIQFHNFKVLRHTTLPLDRCTILVGPNGSGKTTVLQAMQLLAGRRDCEFADTVSVSAAEDQKAAIAVRVSATFYGTRVDSTWGLDRGGSFTTRPDHPVPDDVERLFQRLVHGIRVYSFDADAIAAPVKLQQNMELAPSGARLAGVLDRLRDHDEERFEALNEEFSRWLPEFDRITFDLTDNSQRTFSLRTRDGHHKIPATDVSQGTLLALAMLTLAYLPDPPTLIGLEEPDRGIHPRLLRHVQDALFRISNPESCGEKRDPVQVIATTHSPYFLDLFKDHPEEIVIANRVGDNVQFDRLSDRRDIRELLGSSPLGEVWFSGILGGVPTTP